MQNYTECKSETPRVYPRTYKSMPQENDRGSVLKTTYSAKPYC